MPKILIPEFYQFEHCRENIFFFLRLGFYNLATMPLNVIFKTDYVIILPNKR
jgi:hypothetical protein